MSGPVVTKPKAHESSRNVTLYDFLGSRKKRLKGMSGAIGNCIVFTSAYARSGIFWYRNRDLIFFYNKFHMSHIFTHVCIKSQKCEKK